MPNEMNTSQEDRAQATISFSPAFVIFMVAWTIAIAFILRPKPVEPPVYNFAGLDHLLTENATLRSENAELMERVADQEDQLYFHYCLNQFEGTENEEDCYDV